MQEHLFKHFNSNGHDANSGEILLLIETPANVLFN